MKSRSPQRRHGASRSCPSPRPPATDLLLLFALGTFIARLRGVEDPENVSQQALANALIDYDPALGPLKRRFLWFLNCAIVNFLRRWYRRPTIVPLDSVAANDLPAFIDTVSEARPSCLRAVLDQFPRDLVELLFLHHGLGFSVRDLAAREKIGVSAMKMRLKRGRNLLAAMLRAANCFSLDDVEELGASGVPVLLAPPLPARTQTRPSCLPRPARPL